jgi:hypothetical protein
MLARTISLTLRVYTPDAIRQTIETFANICEASFTVTDENCVLQIAGTGPQPVDEFLNYALALSAQERLA